MRITYVEQCFVFISLLVCSTMDVKSQTNFAWGRQFGTNKEDVGLNAVADQSGNIFIAGSTSGSLSGDNLGNSDGVLSKLDSAGNILWTKQFGTSENDAVNWITIDKWNNIYLTGVTNGKAGTKSYGSSDIWIVKTDSSGTITWQQQYGTDSLDAGTGIYVNEKGEIFVSGITKGKLPGSLYGKTDCVFLKLDENGNKIFILQFGTPEDERCNGISGDAGQNIYISGMTFGDLSCKNKGRSDAFVGIFNNKGEQIKIIQYGTDNYESATVTAIDKEGNIYIGGSTGGDLAGKQQGEGDCYIAKMDTKGEFIWIKQFGTELWDGILGIDMNEKVSDNIVVSGCQHWPQCQSFIRMFKSNGDPVWTRNSIASGKFGGTCGKGVCFDRKGNVYHTGITGGNLFNAVQGEHDIFVVKYEPEKN